MRRLCVGACWFALAMLPMGMATDAGQPRDLPITPAGPLDAALAARRGYVDSTLGQLHYQRMGGEARVLLIHQVPWFHIYFTRAQEALARLGVGSIAIDLPGYGFSDRPASPPGINDYARALHGGLDGLGIERIAIVGHHTGATVATEMTRIAPARTACLVLHGVPLYSDEERDKRLAVPHWEQTPDPQGEYLANRYRYLRERVVGSPQALHWSVLAMYLAGPMEWYGHHAVFKYDMAGSLATLAGPVVVLSNSDDLLDFTFERVKALRPDFRFQRLVGQSSNMAFDEPDAWARAIIAALAYCSRA
ncbi:MAG: alpha/beta hydrolase [Steroidobacteraceae bacterium]